MDMFAYVSGQQHYTKNLGWGFENGRRGKRGSENRTYTKKQVKCLNTGKIFPSADDAITWCGLKNTAGISSVCHKRQNFAGKHPETSEPLIWEYID